MKLKVIIIAITLNCLNLVFTQNQVPIIQKKNNYQIYNEKYITDSNGNIRINVNIWGHVTNPGNHLVPEGIDMVTLLSTVGGPSDGASLDRIKLIREEPGEDGKLVFTLDFNKFLNSGDRSNFIKIKPNDTIVIPQKLSSILLSRVSAVNTLLSLITIYIQIISVL